MMDMCYRCMQPAVVDGRCTNCHSPIVQRDPVGDANLLPLGTKLDEGNVIVGDKLGVGGFGITYIAHDSKFGLIALKEFFPSFYATRQGTEIVPMADKLEPFDKTKKDFNREVKQLIHLRAHPNIVRVLFQFEENNTIYYGMELLQGETLLKYLGRMGPLSPVDAFVLLEPIMNALSFAHKKHCIHRDIAPDNIFLRKDSSMSMGVSPCLIDFGAAFTDEDGFTRVIPNVGKSGFSPIEQASGSSIQGDYTDVYALAATYYYMITKKIPVASKERAFNGMTLEPPSKYASAATPKLDSIIMKAMELSTKDRIQTVDELHRSMREELIGYVQELTPPEPIPPEPAPPEPGIEPVPIPPIPEDKPPKRKGGLALIACLLEWAIFFGVALSLTQKKMPDMLIVGVAVAVLVNLISLMLFKGATFGMRLAGITTGKGLKTPSFWSALFYSILRTVVPLHLLAEIIALCSGTPPFTEVMSGLASYRKAKAEKSNAVKAEPAKPSNSEPNKAVPAKKPEPEKKQDKPEKTNSNNYLQCISGSMRGENIALGAKQKIGREVSMDIQIRDDAKVSRAHCEIISELDSWYIQDTNSHNGTFVNQKRINPEEKIPLSNGDMIRIGSEEFVFNKQQ